jgi:hypothetical protein
MTFDYVTPNNYLQAESDSAMIQAAVDEAAKTGSEVIIPRVNRRTGRPVWVITEAVKLPSGSFVVLDNCHLRLADHVYCNIFKNSNARTPLALTREGRQHDIHIVGRGNALLDGGNHNGLYESNSETGGLPNIIENTMIHMHNVERLTIEHLRIVDHRHWGITCHYCAQGRIAHLSFKCDVNHKNMDGVDLRTGCSDFVIEDLTGSTGDDMVALTNIPYCERYDVEGMDRSIHSVIIRNIRALLTGNHALVRLLNQGGRKLFNILVDGVIDLSSEGEELHRPYATIRIGDIFYNYGHPMAKLGDTHSITVRNVLTRGHNAVYVACTLQDSVFDNIRLFGDAGCALFFNKADARNIHVSNLHYNEGCRIPAVQRGDPIQTTEDHQNLLSGIYFHGSRCENLQVRHMTMGLGADAVAAGTGSRVHMRLEDLVRQEDTPLLNAEGVVIDTGAQALE